MTTSDLLNELNKETFKADVVLEIKLSNIALQQLDDVASHVSGLAVKCPASKMYKIVRPAVGESLREIALIFLENLIVLLSKGGDVAYGSCFSNLTRFVIQGCPSIKRLFPIHLVPNLKNLQRLYVLDCPLKEEIFGAEEEEEESKMVEKKNYCCLPKLSIFWLVDLPELKRLCGGRGGSVFGFLKSCFMKVQMCPNLQSDGIAAYIPRGRSVSFSLKPNEVAA